MHTVPTFKDSSVTLTDSHAILVYLCENYSKEDSSLWPSDPIERINVLNKLFYSGTILFRRDSDAIVSITIGNKLKVYRKNLLVNLFQGQIIMHKLKKEQVEEHTIKLREQYDILEKFLTTNTFIAGVNV